MKTASPRLFATALVSASLALALAGCGGPTIVGAWVTGDGSTFDFNADNTFRTEKTSMSDATRPGCSVRVAFTGNYTLSATTLTLNTTGGGSGRSGCTNESDNEAYSESPGTLPPLVYTYTLSGARLTLSDAAGSNTVYTMR